MTKDGLPVDRRTVLTGGLATAASVMLPATVIPAPALADLPQIPREKTMVLIGINARDGRWVDYELWNPYAIGSNHQNGINLIYEPLAYYSAFANKMYMWLAEGYEYAPDFKKLTIKTRPGITWSDGTPFSAEDVAYTFNTLRDLGPKAKWGIDVNQALQEAVATDPNTVVMTFKIPSPRFFFFTTYKFDIGVPIVPKHIFQGQDWPSFKHFDAAKGWPVTTGPWKVAEASLQQKVFDRRDRWWAAERKLAPMPEILRSIWLPFVAEQQSAQAMITNQVDMGGVIQPATFPTVIRQNAKITTYTGQQPPYGYVDWWPISLYLNNEDKPYDDRDVRWAISHYIDRKQIVDVGYLGAASVSSLPMPPYPPLQPYFDVVKDLLAKHDTLAFDPKKGDALLEAKGFKKSGDAWMKPDGSPLTLEIIGFGGSGPAIGPVLSQMLKRRGVAASIGLPPNFDDRFQKGQYTGAIYGHGGSIREPYDTLRLYQGKSIAVPGAHLVNFSRWRNTDFDKIVDEVYITDPTNVPKLKDLFRAAMEIWLPDLPDVQLVQNYHRIPLNTMRWTNWPGTDNAYINTASWHLTFPLVLWNLKPA
ncbi:ABC transporter substrate-binding protein [Rhodopila sp.]|jgi:peptide/nickel transport system substrate-binding protein|uniref:ABC transporter substrate-binding protein n=1 Tax=Rhodopila sp. TaxID=2480087 RepID=UPI002C847267|nr:ABC transporter substrate-binding protein [Rhodopila sp.]HVZ08179.1 ABC transporter substrate-binding protein [Rhodopila sp.]